MKTMQNAIEELVIEVDAAELEEREGRYVAGEVAIEIAVEPGMLAIWAGIGEGTTMLDLIDAAPQAWQAAAGKDGQQVWFRGVEQPGPAMLVQLTRANPATAVWLAAQLDGVLAA